MTMSLLFRYTLLCSLTLKVCNALYAAKGTPCAPSCNITGGTYWPDLVCSDSDFASTARGQTLQSCLDCTIDSTYINSSYTDGNSDQWWTLFHLKYVQETCLIDNVMPHIAPVNACTSACSPLGDVLKTLWINSKPYEGQYDYCTEDSSAYPNNAADCARCLQAQDGSVIIGNMVDTMRQACDTRPLAANGELIVPARDLFDTVVVSSAPAGSSTAFTSAASATGRSTSSTTSSSTSPPSTGQSTGTASANSPGGTDQGSSSGQDGLSTGAAAGIGAGIAVLAIAIIAGLWVLFRRKRRAGSRGRPAHAVELSSPPPTAKVFDHKYDMHIQEKGVDGQLHEADGTPQSRLVELPAAYKR